MAKPVLQILLIQTPTRFLLGKFPCVKHFVQVFLLRLKNTLEKTALIVKYGGKQNATMATMTTKHENSSVLERERSASKPPKLYKVLLMNDDFTTMEFVIEVLGMFFGKNLEQATHIMLKIHNEGSAVCGVYSKDIAETKVAQVTEYATRHGHPLKCHMEETQ